jgi:hypothetical protein
VDAGSGATVDGSAGAPVDAGAGEGTVDGTVDAGVDAATDAGTDAAADAGAPMDAGADARVDAGADAGAPMDAGADARVDAGGDAGKCGASGVGDAAFDAGGCEPGGGDGGASPERVRAFVTSVQGSGDLRKWADAPPDPGGSTSGLPFADAICQARATAAGLSGTFVAWLSDSQSDAYCRVHGLAGKKSANCGQASLPVWAGPWHRTDDFVFAGPIAYLTTVSTFTPLLYTEFGVPLVPPEDAHTGVFFAQTALDGTLNGITCGDWLSDASEFLASSGRTGSTRLWTASGGTWDCAAPAHLACFQREPGGPLPPVSHPAEVFITSASGNGDLSSWPDAGGNAGTAAGDAVCAARALAAGLPGTFKAWLSDATVDAKDRVTRDAEWKRFDAMPVAVNKAALLAGHLFTPVTFDEFGAPVGDTNVLTGTKVDGTKATTHCQGWTSASATDTAMRGRADHMSSRWTAQSASACSGTFRLYCFLD